MDEKRTQVLCSGLLVKSPTKSELKAGFATFWKVRWCVLVRVTYPASSNKDLKLLFCYYKNKDHFNHQSKPIGMYPIFTLPFYLFYGVKTSPCSDSKRMALPFSHPSYHDKMKIKKCFLLIFRRLVLCLIL